MSFKVFFPFESFQPIKPLVEYPSNPESRDETQWPAFWTTYKVKRAFDVFAPLDCNFFMYPKKGFESLPYWIVVLELINPIEFSIALPDTNIPIPNAFVIRIPRMEEGDFRLNDVIKKAIKSGNSTRRALFQAGRYRVSNDEYDDTIAAERFHQNWNRGNYKSHISYIKRGTKLFRSAATDIYVSFVYIPKNSDPNDNSFVLDSPWYWLDTHELFLRLYKANALDNAQKIEGDLVGNFRVWAESPENDDGPAIKELSGGVQNAIIYKPPREDIANVPPSLFFMSSNESLEAKSDTSTSDWSLNIPDEIFSLSNSATGKSAIVSTSGKLIGLDDPQVTPSEAIEFLLMVDPQIARGYLLNPETVVPLQLTMASYSVRLTMFTNREDEISKKLENIWSAHFELEQFLYENNAENAIKLDLFLKIKRIIDALPSGSIKTKLDYTSDTSKINKQVWDDFDRSYYIKKNRLDELVDELINLSDRNFFNYVISNLSESSLNILNGIFPALQLTDKGRDHIKSATRGFLPEPPGNLSPPPPTAKLDPWFTWDNAKTIYRSATDTTNGIGALIFNCSLQDILHNTKAQNILIEINKGIRGDLSGNGLDNLIEKLKWQVYYEQTFGSLDDIPKIKVKKYFTLNGQQGSYDIQIYDTSKVQVTPTPENHLLKSKRVEGLTYFNMVLDFVDACWQAKAFFESGNKEDGLNFAQSTVSLFSNLASPSSLSQSIMSFVPGGKGSDQFFKPGGRLLSARVTLSTIGTYASLLLSTISLSQMLGEISKLSRQGDSSAAAWQTAAFISASLGIIVNSAVVVGLAASKFTFGLSFLAAMGVILLSYAASTFRDELIVNDIEHCFFGIGYTSELPEDYKEWFGNFELQLAYINNYLYPIRISEFKLDGEFFKLKFKPTLTSLGSFAIIEFYNAAGVVDHCYFQMEHTGGPKKIILYKGAANPDNRRPEKKVEGLYRIDRIGTSNTFICDVAIPKTFVTQTLHAGRVVVSKAPSQFNYKLATSYGFAAISRIQLR